MVGLHRAEGVACDRPDRGSVSLHVRDAVTGRGGYREGLVRAVADLDAGDRRGAAGCYEVVAVADRGDAAAAARARGDQVGRRGQGLAHLVGVATLQSGGVVGGDGEVIGAAVGQVACQVVGGVPTSMCCW